jgi:hypothetical protein
LIPIRLPMLQQKTRSDPPLLTIATGMNHPTFVRRQLRIPSNWNAFAATFNR